ncbi:MAG: patatin-like phospholipase family protein [Elusimicrobia bacterium]|nr:patatin-like phospholipase family protein [Elusimicrobiota bacterium]
MNRGLVLGGGGSWGSWQAGCLYRWITHHGLKFDPVMGISAGALNGAAYLHDPEELKRCWTSLRNKDILTPPPRLFPASLFSLNGLRKFINRWMNEEKAKKEGHFTLYVATLPLDTWLPQNAVFNPQGKWDGFLVDYLLASCAIPWVFPPVKIQVHGTTQTLIDGGVIGKKKVSFSPVADAEEVFVVNVVRPEPIPFTLNPFTWLNNHFGKHVIGTQMAAGIESLKNHPKQPRTYHFYPSQDLDFYMLDFSTQKCQKAFQLGFRDADEFIQNKERYLVSLSTEAATSYPRN